MSAHAADFTDLELNEIIAEALEARRINWCRARLLHALAGAEKQGVLGPVLDELVPDAPYFVEDVHRLLVKTLDETGWMTQQPAFEPGALTDAQLKKESEGACWRRARTATKISDGVFCYEIGQLLSSSWCRKCRSLAELARRRGER